MNPILVTLGILWGLPTSIVGLLLAILGGAVPHRRLPAGVWQWTAIQGSGRFWGYFFIHWGYVATTFGQVSIVHPLRVNDAIVIRHERAHTIQSWMLGVFFLPVYLGEWLWELRRDHGNQVKAYTDIPLEVAAYAAEVRPDAFG